MKATINSSLLARLKPTIKPYDVRDDKLTGFLVRVNISGKLVYMCEYTRGKRVSLGKVDVLTVAQARDQAKQVLGKAAMGLMNHNKAKNKQTLAKFINDEYGVWRSANRKCAEKDLQRLRSNFMGEFGDHLLMDITALAIDKWRSKRINNGIKPVTVNRDISILKAMLNKAEEWNIISKNPLHKFKLASVDSIAKVRYLTNDEEKRLKKQIYFRDKQLKQSRSRFNKWKKERGYELLPDLNQFTFADHMTPMIVISLNTGLRKGELFNLKWENLNFERAMVTVTGDIAKSGKTRHIPLNTTALQILSAWQKQSQSNGLIFPSDAGLPFNNVKKAWASILKAAKIENFRWHDMRHHFASRLVMAGVDLNTVRELLGHADIKMTLRYAHLAPEHKANAVEKLVN